ncbi:GNAT family N-acetyltransferase [Streptomyces sp. NPDC058657]|uniref:GNAT family N-acetyltransferase n=1 Tax=unclassified Streptomyces TaxID=2593676 RepID=UPI00364940C7
MIDTTAHLTFRLADPSDLMELVRLHDAAARWMTGRGIDQWKPGQKDAAHFRHRMREGEVWLAEYEGAVVGAYELWWEDEGAWGPQPPVAGYVHRLMTDRAHAPAGTGRALLAAAEERIAGTGRPLARLDCVAHNPRLRTYYEAAGYRFAGENTAKEAPGGAPSYAVTLLEKALPGDVPA